jgi:tetratricopeptide (TPR) repeat protein
VEVAASPGASPPFARQAVVESPTVPRERRPEPAHRNRRPALLVIGGIVLAALIVAGAVGLVQSRRALRVAEERSAEHDRLLIDTELSNLSLARRRGAWPEVLRRFETAEALGYELTPADRLDRARALAASARPLDALAELRQLAESPDLGDLAPRVDLYLGDLLWGLDDQEAERRVRRARGGTLPAAERHYAVGLVAESVPAALRSFQAALQADRFHREARSRAGLALLLLGRVEEARSLLEQSLLLFADDPDFLLPLAVIHGLRGDAAARDRSVARLKEHLPKADVEAAAVTARLLPLLLFNLRSAIGGRSGQDVPAPELSLAEAARRGGPSLERIVTAERDASGHEVRLASIRLPRSVRPYVNTFRFVVENLTKPNGDLRLATDERARSVLTRVTDDHPEAVLRGVQATFLMMWANTAAANSREYVKRVREAAGAFERAAQSPGLVDVRRQVLEGALLMRALLASPSAARPDRASARLSVDHLRQLLLLGPLPAGRLAVYTQIAQNAGDVNLAREILARWQRVAPNAPELAVRRAEVEYQAGNYSEAFRLATAILKRRKDPNVKELRDRARVGLEQALRRRK